MGRDVCDSAERGKSQFVVLIASLYEKREAQVKLFHIRPRRRPHLIGGSPAYRFQTPKGVLHSSTLLVFF